ncbi:MAG: sulfatase-like hydrolase/transferase, partial [Halobacteriaceae archaeon]
LRKVRSQGSASDEFLRNNFTDYYDDIVYFSTNSFVSPTEHGGFDSSEHFHETIPVYLEDLDEEKKMQTPEAVTSYFLEHESKYPHKRKILHFMQPHGAYIGDFQLQDQNADVTDLWGRYPKEQIWKAYCSNLKRVLEEVEKLLEELDGKIVVTADHGEAFGEKWVVGHPAGVRIQELIEVPWLVVNKGNRPQINDAELPDIDI